MRSAWQRALALAAGLLLAACASSPDIAIQRPARITGFSLEGRLSLRQGDQNNSGRVSWDHKGDRDDILLSTPLGQGVAELSGNSHEATLSLADKRTYTAPDVEALSEQAFGTRLPLKQMPAWVLGRPSDTGQVTRDEQGRPSRFQDSGWTVEYLGYESADPHALPTLLRLERGDIELRLKIQSWDQVE